MVQGQAQTKARLYQKNKLKVKRDRGVTEELEHLPSKHKALSSSTHTNTYTKKKKKNQ
jgi:hypothetical protein